MRFLDDPQRFSLTSPMIADNQKIKCLIQIGANDGSRFDELNIFIKKYKIKSVLVEPINEYFEDLKRNYKKGGQTIHGEKS